MCPNSYKFTHIILWTGSMWKVYKNGKKLTWWQETKIATGFYHSLAASETMSLLFKEQKQKRLRMSFWDCHVTSYKGPNRHFLQYAILSSDFVTSPKVLYENLKKKKLSYIIITRYTD